MTHQKARLISILLIAGLLLVLLPWRVQIVPAWKLRVIDEQGKPIPSLAVSENWIDPNLTFLWLEEDFKTNEDGFVNFPERYTWQNILLKVAAPVWNRVLSGS